MSNLARCLDLVKASKEIRDAVAKNLGGGDVKGLITEAEDGLEELRAALKDQHGVDLSVVHLDDAPPDSGPVLAKAQALLKLWGSKAEIPPESTVAEIEAIVGREKPRPAPVMWNRQYSLSKIDRRKEALADKAYRANPTRENGVRLLESWFKSALHEDKGGTNIMTADDARMADRKFAITENATDPIYEIAKAHDLKTRTGRLKDVWELQDMVAEAAGANLRELPRAKNRSEKKKARLTLLDPFFSKMAEELGHVRQDRPTIRAVGDALGLTEKEISHIVASWFRKSVQNEDVAVIGRPGEKGSMFRISEAPVTGKPSIADKGKSLDVDGQGEKFVRNIETEEAPPKDLGEDQDFGGSVPIGHEEELLPEPVRFRDDEIGAGDDVIRKYAEELIPADATPDEVRKIVEGARTSWAKVRAHDSGYSSKRSRSRPGEWADDYLNRTSPTRSAMAAAKEGDESKLANPGEEEIDEVDGFLADVQTGASKTESAASRVFDALFDEAVKPDVRERAWGGNPSVNTKLGGGRPRGYEWANRDAMVSAERERLIGKFPELSGYPEVLEGMVQAHVGRVNYLPPGSAMDSPPGKLSSPGLGSESRLDVEVPAPSEAAVREALGDTKRPGLASPSMTGMDPDSLSKLPDSLVRELAVDLAMRRLDRATEATRKNPDSSVWAVPGESHPVVKWDRLKGAKAKAGDAEREALVRQIESVPIEKLRGRIADLWREEAGVAKPGRQYSLIAKPTEYSRNAFEAVAQTVEKGIKNRRQILKNLWGTFRVEMLDNTARIRDFLSEQAGVDDIRDIVDLAKAGKIGLIQAQAYHAMRQAARLGSDIEDILTTGLRAEPHGVDRSGMVYVVDQSGGMSVVSKDAIPQGSTPVSFRWVTETAKSEQDIMDASWVALKRHLDSGRLGKQAVDFSEARIKEIEHEWNQIVADPDRLAKAEVIANRMRTFSGATLDMARRAGLISADTQDMWSIMHPDHFGGMQRLVKELGESNLAFNQMSLPFHKAHGSDIDMHNPLVNMMQNYAKVYQAAVKNNARKLLLQAMEQGKAARQTNMRTYWKHTTLPTGDIKAEQVPLERIDDTKSAEDVSRALKTYENGEARYWEVSDEQLMTDIRKMTEGSAITNYTVGKVMASLAGMTRWAVTHTPAFAIRNMIKDFQHRLILSPTMRGGRGLGDALAAAKEGATDRKGLGKQLTEFGGDQAGFYAKDREDYGRLMRRELRGKLGDTSVTLTLDGMNNLANRVLELGETYADWISRTEKWGRLAEFESAQKALRAAGMIDQKAINKWSALMAADILDYSVHGNFIKHLAPVIPFLNASIQGSARMFREILKGGFNKEVASRWALYCVAPEVAVYAINKAMGSDEEWHELPAYQKDMFYSIKVPLTDNLWLRIPKPYELGVLSSGVVRGLDSIAGSHGEGVAEAFGAGEWLENVATTGVPSANFGMLSGPLKVVLESTVNYNFFKKEHIVSPFEERLDVRLRQGTKNASAMAQMFQDVLGAIGVGVDARYIDSAGGALVGDFWRVPGIMSDAVSGEKHVGKARLLNAGLGVFSQTPGAAAGSVTGATELTARLGVQREGDVARLRDLKKSAFASRSDAEYEAKARSMRTLGRQIEKKYADPGVFKRALDKANAKAESLRQ